jgi:hypothetical protein
MARAALVAAVALLGGAGYGLGLRLRRRLLQRWVVRQAMRDLAAVSDGDR